MRTFAHYVWVGTVYLWLWTLAGIAAAAGTVSALLGGRSGRSGGG